MDPLTVLRLPKNASFQQICEAYECLCRCYNPEEHPGDPLVRMRYNQIVQAFEILKSEMDEAVTA